MYSHLFKSLDEACELFTSKFIELAKTCIPNNFVIVRPNDKPWYTSEIRLASRQRDRLHDKAKTSTNLLIGIITKRLETKLTI